MSQLWGRKYKITVANKKTGKAWDVSNLRCLFRVEKNALVLSNISVIHVFNLSGATDTAILKEGSRVIIEAGYEGADDSSKSYAQYGQIYDGDIVQIIRTKDNNLDYDLTLVCLDGDDFLNQNTIIASMAANSTPRDTVDLITKNSRVKLDQGRVSDDLEKTKLPRGKILFGQPRDYLRKIAYENNGTFWVDDGKIYLDKTTDIPAGESLVLTPQTGLIGYPSQTDQGVEFKCLLNPRIKLKCMCKIDNSAVRRLQASARGRLFTPLDEDGEYQVVSLTHSGDTRGEEWYTTVCGISRLGAGKIPLLMSNQNQNVMGGGD